MFSDEKLLFTRFLITVDWCRCYFRSPDRREDKHFDSKHGPSQRTRYGMYDQACAEFN